MNDATRHVLPLHSELASLDRVGGKGRSLAKLVAADLPVPSGFFVTTRAYNEFVDHADLRSRILSIVARSATNDDAAQDATAAHHAAAESISRLFEATSIPESIASDIRRATEELSKHESNRQFAVAVRSSATAEDLPELSFAGQQESFLNVREVDSILDATRRCWASLWTARAISYRARMNIDHRSIAMGVVVQRMVEAEVSGILFTANPADGGRNQFVINASYGLGEAIVGGQVTPDSYIVDRTSREVTHTTLGSKNTMVVATTNGGTDMTEVSDVRRHQLALPRDVMRRLADLAAAVETLFDNIPQDIEWAVHRDKVWLLQSRPITNLPPAPLENVSWDPPAEGVKLIRRQVVENMPLPLSPLFEELYLDVGLEESTDRMLDMWKAEFRIEELMDRPMFMTVNGFAYCRASYHSTWRLIPVMPRILFWYMKSIPRLIRNVIPQWQDEGLPNYLEQIETWKAADSATMADEKLLEGIRRLAIADAVYWFSVAIVLAMAKITDDLLNWGLQSTPATRHLTSGIFLRGFESKTMDAQTELESIARQIRASDELRSLVLSTPADELLCQLDQPTDDAADLRIRILGYLEQYGHQVYNLDFVQPTQAEDPRPVLMSLKTLVANAEYDTCQRQSVMATERHLLEQRTLQSLGPLRRWQLKKLLSWAQKYGPHREQALFYIGAAWPTLRRLALELGRRLVESESISAPDDLFFLNTDEISKAIDARRPDGETIELAELAAERRQLRQSRLRLHPPGMVPEGSRFRFGPLNLSAFETQKRNEPESGSLEGFAVSPGKVTGRTSVILSPADFSKMKPDTILVCPTTTPAWTPLFAQAIGLVTDIGGVLAHGSIVAREYGIPAVMGTGNATRRLTNSQIITVDGDSGMVTIEE